MPPDVGSAADWLRRARASLVRARQPVPEGAALEDYCFDAQQAAEKALKAVILHLGGDYRKIHDIAELVSHAKLLGADVPPEVAGASAITVYAVQTRYPGEYEPVDALDLAQAVESASAVVAWAEDQLKVPHP